MRGSAVALLIGLAFACAPENGVEPTILRPHLDKPHAAVLPATSYTADLVPREGWFSDVNGANLIVGMADGEAVAMQLGGFLTTLPKAPGIWARAEAVNERDEIVGSVDIGKLNQPKHVPAYWARTGVAPVLLSYAGRAMDINDHGFVVGAIWNARGQSIAFYWNPATGSLGRESSPAKTGDLHRPEAGTTARTPSSPIGRGLPPICRIHRQAIRGRRVSASG